MTRTALLLGAAMLTVTPVMSKVSVLLAAVTSGEVKRSATSVLKL